MTAEKEKNGYVSWRIFVWAISIIIFLIGLVFNSMASLGGRVNDVKDGFSSIREDVRELKTNVAWLVDNYKRGEK